jgi:hypothetical protein
MYQKTRRRSVTKATSACSITERGHPATIYVAKGQKWSQGRQTDDFMFGQAFVLSFGERSYRAWPT